MFNSHANVVTNDCQVGTGHWAVPFFIRTGDGRKVPDFVKSLNVQRATAKSPKIPGGWQHFATKFIEIEIHRN